MLPRSLTERAELAGLTLGRTAAGPIRPSVKMSEPVSEGEVELLAAWRAAGLGECAPLEALKKSGAGGAARRAPFWLHPAKAHM